MQGFTTSTAAAAAAVCRRHRRAPGTITFPRTTSTCNTTCRNPSTGTRRFPTEVPTGTANRSNRSNLSLPRGFHPSRNGRPHRSTAANVDAVSLSFSPRQSVNIRCLNSGSHQHVDSGSDDINPRERIGSDNSVDTTRNPTSSRVSAVFAEDFNDIGGSGDSSSNNSDSNDGPTPKSLLDLLDQPIEDHRSTSVGTDASGNHTNLLDLLGGSEEDGDDNNISSNDSASSEETLNDVLNQERIEKKLKRRQAMQRVEVSAARTALDEPPRFQSRHNSNLLFASIAPHIEKRELTQLRNRLNKFVKTAKRNITQFEESLEETGRGRVRGELKKLFGSSALLVGDRRRGRMEILDTATDDVLGATAKGKAKNRQLSLETHGWMKPLLINYFANFQRLDDNGQNKEGEKDENRNGNEGSTSSVTDGKDSADGANCELEDDRVNGSSSVDTSNRTPIAYLMDESAIYSEPTFPPNINRGNIDRTVEILMQAREKCLGPDPLFWSKKKAKSSARSRARREKVLIKQTMEKKRQAQAQEKGKGPNVSVDSATTDISRDDVTLPFEVGSDLKRSRINILRAKHAEKTSEVLRREAELLAQLLANRLPSRQLQRLTDQLELYAKDNDEHDLKKKRNSIRKDRILPKILCSSVPTHVHLVAADVAEFLYVGIPDSIREKDAASAAAEMAGSIKKKGTHSFDDRINAAWVEWTKIRDEVSTAFMEAQHVLVAVENLWRKQKEVGSLFPDDDDGVESLIAKLEREAEQQELERRIKAASVKRRGPHAVFDAMLLNEKFDAAVMSSKSEVGNGEIVADIDRTIFVDCLPIDITENEVRELYSRCGPVESVQLFNARPDLDPGELSQSQMNKQRKRNRRAGAKQLKKKERRRSPVYAMVTFETEEGYKTASIDQLRIFGMIIRRHPVRTIRARDAIILHLENIPRGLYSIDLEQKLSRALHPDIYIGLDVGQNDYAKPASCEIRFPNFEAAFRAFSVLEKIDMKPESEDDEHEKEGPQCALHWMKTPDDAVGYWTRKLNFDP